MFRMKILLLFFLRSYSPFLRGSLSQIPKRKVDLQQLYKYEFNYWTFSAFCGLWQMGHFLVPPATAPWAGRQLRVFCYELSTSCRDELIAHGIDLATVTGMRRKLRERWVVAQIWKWGEQKGSSTGRFWIKDLSGFVRSYYIHPHSNWRST